MFSQELLFSPCSHSYISAVCAGWATFIGWKMGTFLRIYSVTSLPLGLGAEAAPKDVHKHNLKACNIDTESWEAFADNRTLWKQQV